ncbi:MAG: hypothetical protein R3B89_16980 [Polyangiaceae bacterium]
MSHIATPHPRNPWLSGRLPRGTLILGLLCATLSLVGVADAHTTPARSNRLPSGVDLAPRPLVFSSDDGAVLERSGGGFGVRAWAQEPGSCLGPAGLRAQHAARSAARELLSEARFQIPAQLALVGTSELDVQTPSGVHCSVEIVVSHIRRSSR